MATIPTTAPVSTTAPASSARAVGAYSRVASVASAEVDPLDISADISFDARASGFEEQREQSGRYGDDQPNSNLREPRGFRLFSADSQSFASIFEEPDRTARNARSDDVSGRRNGAPVGQIINTYETNALIITGQQPIRGTSLSFSL